MNERVNILIPTIRKEKARRCIDAVWANAGIDRERIKVLMSPDRKRIGCPRMVKWMADQVLCEDWPWVCFLGDDTIPEKDFLAIAFAYAETLPDGWGLVGLNDGHHHGFPATHWLAHMNLLPLLGGEFFNTAYQHCYCDIELTQRAADLGRYVWAEEARLEHDHPIFTGEPMDDDYSRVYSPWVKMKDLATFNQRRQKGWPL